MKFKTIFENISKKYDYSSIQFDLFDPIKEMIISEGKKIPENSLYIDENNYGRDSHPHCTILYGIHTKKVKEVRQLMSLIKPFTIVLRDISFFKLDNYDVLKINVESNKLMKINNYLKDSLNHTSTFPIYKPHVTIAYVRKDFVPSMNLSLFNGISTRITQITFCSKDGDQEKIILGV